LNQIRKFADEINARNARALPCSHPDTFFVQNPYGDLAMSMIRWDPLSEFESLFSRIGPSIGRWPRLTRDGDGEVTLEWSPWANISETDKEYLVRAELPGLQKEDVKVTLGDGVLTIAGERTRHKEETSEKFHRTESSYGSFSRTFSLPDNIIADAIRCESKDGVLTVHIPKTEQRKPKQIAVQ
jgi:HSP20 family protein